MEKQNKAKNILLSSCDDSYFKSLIILIDSLKKSTIHKIIVLDIGLNRNHINLLERINNVSVINFSEEFSKLDKFIGCSYFSDNKTYGFKPYLLKNFHTKTPLGSDDTYNILYVDAGIKATKSLDHIFDIINKEDIFCIDHSSEMRYGNIENLSRIKCKYGRSMLLNILPPQIYQLFKSKEIIIDDESLTRDYIKAGFFGYKLAGKYQHIIDDNLELYIQSLVGIFPTSNLEQLEKIKFLNKTSLTEYEKKCISQMNTLSKLYNKNSLSEKLYTTSTRCFYRNLIKKYLSNRDYYSDEWVSQRHDQTILSFLINKNLVSHHKSSDYMITLYQKTHFMKYIYYQAVFLLEEERNNISDLENIDKSYEYSLDGLGLDSKYLSCQYIQIKYDDLETVRAIYSDKDILYKKYNHILKIRNIQPDEYSDKLYYNLLINWNANNNSHKRILLKSNKYAILTRNNVTENINVINMIKNIGKKLFIMGNGPSLASIMNNKEQLDLLRKQDTFGLNAAYRAYEKYNFYPTYFGCFDSKVCKFHSDEFEKLIMNSPIQKFFFINFDEKGEPIFTNPKILNHPKFVNINFILRKPLEKKSNKIIAYDYSYFIDMLTSGTNSVQCGMIEGYKNIYLLGCDCNYTEVIKGAKLINNNRTLLMTETPDKNPNYWIDDYQQEGDVFNLPNVSGCQLPAWVRLYDTVKFLDINVKIVNCSLDSKIECFEKQDIKTLL